MMVTIFEGIFPVLIGVVVGVLLYHLVEINPLLTACQDELPRNVVCKIIAVIDLGDEK